jgi:hypothetical protein
MVLRSLSFRLRRQAHCTVEGECALEVFVPPDDIVVLVAGAEVEIESKV